MGNGASAQSIADKSISNSAAGLSKAIGGMPADFGEPSMEAAKTTAPLTTADRQRVYEPHPDVVSLQDPNFSKNWLGSFAVRPQLPDNPSTIPDAFLPTNQKYGVNKQWVDSPALPGSTFSDRLKSFALSPLNPNPLKNTAFTPDPRNNIATNPEKAIGNLIGGDAGRIITNLNPLSWF